MIVRELVARMGLKVDEKSFHKADARVDKLKKVMSTVSDYITVGVAAIGFKRVIDFASDANETLNVLNSAFEDNTQAVLDWSKSFGDSAQRSQYQMQEIAGSLGAVLNPLLDNNADKAANMSMRLTQLAVDLGSFYNATDDEALTALRAGIVGESEPLKRFGIVMLEANLAAYALEKGITKSYRSMTLAEKTELRYNYLVEKTAMVHGDAAKTAEGFANASKGLLGGLRDLATLVGYKFLPFVEYLTRGMRDLVRGLAAWAEQSHIVEVALIVLASVAVKAGLSVLAAWLPVLLPFIKVVAIITLLTLALDDFLTFLDGGKSVIGEFINYLFGPGSAEEAANFLKQTFQDIVTFGKDYFIPTIEKIGSTISNFVTFLIDDFKALIDNISSIFNKLNDTIKEYTGIDIKAAVNWVIDKHQALGDQAMSALTGIDVEQLEYGRTRVKERKEEEQRKKSAQARAEQERKARGEYTVEELLAMKQAEKKNKIKIKANAKAKREQDKIDKAQKRLRLKQEKKDKKEAQDYARKKGLTVASNITNKIQQTNHFHIDGRSNNDLASKIEEKIKRANRDTHNKTFNNGQVKSA